MPDDQIKVKTDRVEHLADRLRIFGNDAQIEMANLENALSKLSGTWRDAEYDKFRKVIKRSEDSLHQFLSELNKIDPQLRKDLETLKAYTRIEPR